MYAISLDKDFRILSATFEKYADKDDILVSSLPNDDITDYKYINNEYIYEPIPKPNIRPIPTLEERLVIVEEQNKKLQAQNDELTLALADVYGGGNI